MKLFSSSGKFSNGQPTTAKKRSSAFAPARNTENVFTRSAANVETASVERRPARPNPMETPASVRMNAAQTAPQAVQQEGTSQFTPQQKAALKKRKAAKRRNRQIILGGVAIFLAIMLATFGFFAIRKSIASSAFRDMIKEIQEIEENEAAVTPDDSYEIFTAPTDPVSGDMEPALTEPEVKTIMSKYAPLYLDNPEFFGWVKIEDTRINYPVMRSFEDNDEYLYTNFKGKYSYCGIPFADIKCSHDSDNILIYGHNMNDGTMFASLFKYEKESFYKKHPTVIFSDLYEDYEYEILSVFYDRVYEKSDKVFKFYQFIDAADESAFDYAIDQLKEKSLYDTGVEAEYGDKLIMLVTCAYHVDDGRFVVVARRK